MMFRDVITLVSESPAAHGVLDDVTETQKQVFCSVRSVGMTEAYQAMSNGLHPQFVFVLSECADYNGEKIVIYHDKRYRIIRTYQQNQGMELTVEEVTIDA